MLTRKFTPEAFEKKSEKILSIFTSTISGLEAENEIAENQTELNKEIIEKKIEENNRIQTIIGSNKNFINKLNDLFN